MLATTTDDPGPKTSTQDPQLLKLLTTSRKVVAATTIGSLADAGEILHASEAELPAAATIAKSARAIVSTAVFTAVLKSPPTDRFTTTRRADDRALVLMKSSAARMLEVEPEPLQSSTRTEMRFAVLATPRMVPPTTDATPVPWP
jgi:hypothetical protein